MPDGPTRILLADDHAMVRDGLKRLINEESDMVLVAEASDGTEAIRLCEELAPHVALIDVSMPGWTGMHVARLMAGACPGVRVIALTRHDDPGFVREMFEAGAAGYVLKQSASAELIRAIRTVVAGRRYVDPSIRESASFLERGDPDVHGTGEPLTEEEERVLRLMARSHSNQEIAALLGTDAAVVAGLKATAMRKAGLGSRLQLALYARSRGWTEAID